MRNLVSPCLQVHLKNRHTRLPSIIRAYKSTYSAQHDDKSTPVVKVDEACVPTRPVWSVHELLSSYPRPTISAEKLDKLHELSALVPPQRGTEQHAKLTRELEEMVRLVEAVKLVDCDSLSANKIENEKSGGPIPDGRVPFVLDGIQLSASPRKTENDDPEASGKALLKYASKTRDGYYVVEQERKYRR